jgi:dihydroorotate dehydrogenase (fumarate)
MNLATNYLGLTLRTPFIVGASPFCDSVHVARRLQDAGAGAVVMRSLFEEQIDWPSPWAGLPAKTAAGATADGPPDRADYQFSPDQYLRQVASLKQNLSIPVIASLNGYRRGGWTAFATRLEQAGADAIELNFYQVVTDPSVAADQVETEMLETVGLVAGAVGIPVAVKLAPFHASVVQLAIALELAGAAGLVLFNRYYQPDVNIEEIEVQPTLHLSDPQELYLRLRWLAILSPQVRGSLAAAGGVHTSADTIKALLTGAHAVQLVSVLLQHGPNVLNILVGGLRAWMERHGYADVAQFRGLLNLDSCRDPAAFERSNYIRAFQHRKA